MFERERGKEGERERGRERGIPTWYNQVRFMSFAWLDNSPRNFYVRFAGLQIMIP
jgi:hypothetical protein